MDIAIASIALVGLILMSYVCAWNHLAAYMAMFLVGAIAVAVFCDTALSGLFNTDEGLRGLDRFLEVGPSFILGASIVVGYYYAWKRMVFHVVVCLGLAAATICLGW